MFKNSKDVSDLNTAEENLRECLGKMDLFTTPKQYDKDGSSPISNIQVQVNGKGSLKTKNLINEGDTKYNKRIILDCLICLAFINFEWNEWQDALKYFQRAFQVSFSDSFYL